MITPSFLSHLRSAIASYINSFLKKARLKVFGMEKREAPAKYIFTPSNSSALFLGVVFGLAVLSRTYYIPLAITGFLVLYLLNVSQRSFLFILAALFPFSIAVGSVQDVLLVELLTPLILLTFLYSKEFNFGKAIRYSGVFVFALSIILTWSIINYMQHPVTASDLTLAKEESGGLRSYYKIIVGCAVFLVSFQYFCGERLKTEKLLLWAVVLSLALGLLRLLSYFYNFGLPFLGENFYYSAASTEYGRNIVYRIGGIDHCIKIGLPALLAYCYRRNTHILMPTLLSLFFVLAVLGGGRTVFLAMCICSFVYLTVFKNKLYGIFVPGFVFLVLIFAYADSSLVRNQFDRVFALDAIANISESDIGRAEVWKLFIEVFEEHPIFGKGIGFVERNLINTSNDELYNFVKYQLVAGGHNGYLSVLAIYGIGGILFLLIMLYGSMFSCVRYLRKYSHDDDSNIIIFILFASAFLAIAYCTGGTGYKEPLLYFCAGSVCGIYAKKSESFLAQLDIP